MTNPIEAHSQTPGRPEPSGHNAPSGVKEWGTHEFEYLRDGTVICTVCDSVVVGAK